MSDANRTAVGVVEETTTLGTTPATPAFEAVRVTGENLSYTPQNIVSNELRPDGQVPDVIRVGIDAGGDLPFEFSYRSMHTLMQGGMFSTWALKPIRSGSANITAASTTALTVLTTGTSETNSGLFAPNHLVRTSGFVAAGNNALRAAGAGTTATNIALAGGTIDAAPAATARAKAIGFAAAAAADVTATASGLGSTTTNFTTFGLQVGEWVKIGGTAAGNKFATAANNGWARISVIAATALTFDILPVGWAVDAAAGVTLWVFIGDTIRNGVTRRSYAIELQYQDLAVPEYEYYNGMVVSQFDINATAKQILTGKAAFLGLNATTTTARFAGATDVAAPTNDVMNAASNVGFVYENGALIAGKNYVMGFTLSVANNLRRNDAVGSIASVDVGAGRRFITGTLDMYYGSNAILTKIRAGTSSSWAGQFVDPNGGKAMLVDLPRIKYLDGNPDSPGVDTDRTIKTKFQAIRHQTLGYMAQIQEFEEYQT